MRAVGHYVRLLLLIPHCLKTPFDETHCTESLHYGQVKSAEGRFYKSREYFSGRKEHSMKIITCEQVSCGHPDKICDQIADAVVTDCLQHDRDSRVAIEVLIKDNHIIIAGELTSSHKPDYEKLVDLVFERIVKEKLD